MKFFLPDYSKSIELQIIQTQEGNKENYIVVGGRDTTWVNGIMARLAQL